MSYFVVIPPITEIWRSKSTQKVAQKVGQAESKIWWQLVAMSQWQILVMRGEVRLLAVDTLNVGFFTRGFSAVGRLDKKKKIKPSLNYFWSIGQNIFMVFLMQLDDLSHPILRPPGGTKQILVHTLIKLFYCHTLSHWTLTTPWYYTPLVPLSSNHGSNQAFLFHLGSASSNIHHSLFSTSFMACTIQPKSKHAI